MFQTIKNAWKTLELRNKLLFTFIILVLYRLGASIPVPYVTGHIFDGLTGTILDYLNTFSGGALSQATLFALGVSPYITSSIVIQLLTVAIPALQKWSQDGDEGRKKINALTRVVTLALAILTAVGYVSLLNSYGALAESTVGDWFRTIVMVACYCAGAMLVMWLAEKINDKGIGNGISMILFANIIAGFSSQASAIWNMVFSKGGFKGFNWLGLVFAVVIIIAIAAFVVLIVRVTDAERRIPIQYAKRVVGRKMYGGQSTNLPIKVNMTGVMPIIFANSIVAIPATIASFTASDGWLANFVNNWFNYNKWPYLVVFFVLLIAFAYFYIAISFNPIEVANNIKNNGGAVPGIRSGRPTVEYITKILYRITLVGALFVAVIAVVPMLAVVIESAIGKSNYFTAVAFGGSSLMIVVGVALETVRELESQLTLRNYKGFLD